jgi:hypothetical protein
MTEHTTIYVKKDYRDKLREIAEENKRSMTSQLEYMIDRWSKHPPHVYVGDRRYEIVDAGELPGPEGAEKPPVVVVRASE